MQGRIEAEGHIENSYIPRSYSLVNKGLSASSLSILLMDL